MKSISPRVRFSITVDCPQGWHEPPRLLYDCELVYVLEGEVKLRIDKNTTLLREGSLALIGPRTEHESWVEPGHTVVRQCLHFDWTHEHENINSPLYAMMNAPYLEARLHPLDPVFHCCINRSYPPAEIEPVRSLLVEVFERLERLDPVGEALLYPVLIYLYEKQMANAPRRVGSRGEQVILESKHYIDVHYREELSVDELSSRCRLSRSHYVMAFRRCVGTPPLKYLNQVRIEHACRLLLQGKMTMGEVACEVGFSGGNYFCRLFKRSKGMTPGEFIRSGPARQ